MTTPDDTTAPDDSTASDATADESAPAAAPGRPTPDGTARDAALDASTRDADLAARAPDVSTRDADLAARAPNASTPRRRAVIALGGNVGDRVETIRRAIRAIDELDDVTIAAASSLYETPAMTIDGVDESAPRYLNAVVIAMMSRRAEDLLFELLRIEDRFGRQRNERWGSRTLDLDLIDVDGIRLATDALQLPHPQAWQRAFVLAPWHEIDPEATLTGHGPIAELLAAATDRVELFATSGLEGRSAAQVSTDRGLPLIGPDSRADPPRPIRGGSSGFGSDIVERATNGHDVTGHSGGSDAWRAAYAGSEEAHESGESAAAATGESAARPPESAAAATGESTAATGESAAATGKSAAHSNAAPDASTRPGDSHAAPAEPTTPDDADTPEGHTK